MRKVFFGLGAVLLVALNAVSFAAQDEDTLRIGYIPIMVMEQHFINSEEGWYSELEELGVSEVEATSFSSGAPMVQAFAAGELDVGFVGINPALVMASRGVPVKVVASNVVDSLAVTVSNEFADIYEDNPGAEAFEIYREQVGRPIRFATLPQGTTPDTVLRLWLDQLGLDAETDISIVPLGVNQVQSALATGEVDGSLIMEPVLSLAQEQEWGYRTIVGGGEILENQPGAVLVVTEELIENNPELVEKLVELHLRASELAIADRDRAAEIASSYIGDDILSVEIARIALDSNSLRVQPNPYSILESTEAYNAFQVALGVFDEPVTQDQLFDLSFYDAVIEAFPEYAEVGAVVEPEATEEAS